MVAKEDLPQFLIEAEKTAELFGKNVIVSNRVPRLRLHYLVLAPGLWKDSEIALGE